MDFQIVGNVARIRFDAAIIADNVKDLVNALRTDLDRVGEYNRVELDLSITDQVDSMGITFLVGVSKTIAAKGKQMKLTGVSKEMRSLFLMMKLDQVFSIEYRQGA